eukprot:11917981-Prorocentrum_lima.AAC.1
MALQKLRREGAKQLASRLSSLSKARNKQAHPDVGLYADIKQHVFDNKAEVLAGSCSANEECPPLHAEQHCADPLVAHTAVEVAPTTLHS